jgi:hypothetical protein
MALDLPLWHSIFAFMAFDFAFVALENVSMVLELAFWHSNLPY